MSLDFYLEELKPSEIFWRNITHNLTPMWDRAGVYDALYNSSGKKAKQIIKVLKKGLQQMTDYPEEYRGLNPENGWGDYDVAVLFLADICVACETHPESSIRIWK